MESVCAMPDLSSIYLLEYKKPFGHLEKSENINILNVPRWGKGYEREYHEEFYKNNLEKENVLENSTVLFHYCHF